jgi:hypothetical protein
MVSRIPRSIRNLNLFYNRFMSNPTTLTNERRSTRLYLILGVCLFVLFFLYDLLTGATITVIVKNPTEDDYHQLAKSYSTSPRCPCKNTDIAYKSYVKLSAQLHPICHSPFIETPWIESLLKLRNWTDSSMNDYRHSGIVYFLGFRSLCRIAQMNIDYIVSTAMFKRVTRFMVLNDDQLRMQTEIDLEQLKKAHTDYLPLFFNISRGMIRTNHLMTLFPSNWKYVSSDDHRTRRLTANPISHGVDCSCATSDDCIEPVYLDGRPVPGLVLGCFPSDSFLRSSLICLYNQTCINHINLVNHTAIHALDQSKVIKLTSNASLQTLFDASLIESWSSSLSYSQFYAVCSPLLCSYVALNPKDLLYVCMFLLGLYGGLTTILRFVAPKAIASITIIVGRIRRDTTSVIPFN